MKLSLKTSKNNSSDKLKKIIFTSFLVVLAALFNHQIIKGEYFLRRARNNYVRALPLPSLRGFIFDRKGEILAKDRASYNIAVVPHQIQAKKNSLFNRLSQKTGINKTKILRNYQRNLRFYFTPADIITDIDKRQALELKMNFPENILINTSPQRHYPQGPEFSHILGYISRASALPEHFRKYGYTPLERVGVYGLEQYYDSYLRGQDGGDLLEVDARGNAVGFLGRRKPVRGNDIHLTIDSQIQKIAAKLMEAKRGVIVLMDSNSGEIIAMYSSPSFDPNLFITGKGLSRLYQDPYSPLINRNIQSSYPIGSVMKPFLAAAGLSEGKIDRQTTFECRGAIHLGRARFRCSRAHGSQDIFEALANSCNVYFYNLGLLVGPENISNWAKKFGLNALTNVDLPHEKMGVVPSPQWKREKFNQNWYAGDTVNLSIGQGYIQITPLAVTLAVNSIANGGYLVEPSLLKKIEDYQTPPAPRKNIGISQANLKIVQEGLRQAVSLDTGTARLLRNIDLEIAGKTGTAQTAQEPHAWFVGYFPYQKPQYTVTVFLENGESSFEAVAVAREFLTQIEKSDLLEIKK